MGGCWLHPQSDDSSSEDEAELAAKAKLGKKEKMAARAPGRRRSADGNCYVCSGWVVGGC